MDAIKADTFQNCLDTCTRQSPACYGVMWSFDPENSGCWPLDNDADLPCLGYRANVTSGLVSRLQVAQNHSEIVCPYRNLSNKSTSTGLEFNILCGAKVEDPGSAIHADSFEECLENCAKSHPLCTQVAYLADFAGGGWLNCWAKTDVIANLTASSTFLSHSTSAWLPSLQEVDCGNDSIFVATGGRHFKTSCEDWRNTTTPLLGESHQVSTDDCAND